MAKKWIKLHRKLLLSKDLNLAANEYGLAERLFYRMLLAADDYGRLPADPWVLRGHIGPLMKVSEKQIVRGLECLQNHGLIAVYNVDSIDYILIGQYHTYQQTDWSKVGAPQCPHPVDWELPKDLRSFLEEHAHQAQFRPDRYGLSASQLRRLLDGDRLQAWRDEIRSRDQLQCRNCGATVGIAIHHILPFRDYPALAYEVKNGISLCAHCHGEAHRENLTQDKLFKLIDPDSTGIPHEIDLMSTAEGTLDVEVDVEVEGDTEKTKIRADSDAPQKKPTPEQKVIELAWEAFGFDGKPGGRGYSGLMGLVQTHGIPIVEKWAAYIKRSPPELPEGAKAQTWFNKQFRDAMNRPWEWQPKSGKSGNTLPAKGDTDYGEPGAITL